MRRRTCQASGWLCLFLVSILLPLQGFADQSDASTHAGTQLTLRVLKGLDFDGWDGEVNSDELLRSGGVAKLDERLKLRFYSIPGYQPRWKTDQTLKFHYDHPLSTSSGLVLAVSQQEYRDQSTRRYRSGRVTQSPFFPDDSRLANAEFFNSTFNDDGIGNINLSVGGRLVTENGIALEGRVGPIFEHRGGVSQEGIKYDFNYGFKTDSIHWSGEGWLGHYGSGDDHNLALEANGYYALSNAANDQFRANYQSGSRREFSAVGNIDGRRNDRRVELANNLAVEVSEVMNFSWGSNLITRTTENNGPSSKRQDREFNWQNQLGGAWSLGEKFVLVAGGIDVQQQEYAGGLTQGRNSRLQIASGFETSMNDSSLIETSVAHYRFDTPDELDFNDRDELRWRAALRAGRHLTPALELKGGIEANLNHLVYIHRSRSGENRWMRQFTLFGEVPWREAPIENTARFAVSAHYTDYDFSPYDLTESRLFRTFTALDTFRLALPDGWGAEVSGSGQLNDHGDLDWSEWIQNVSERGYSYTVTALPFRRTSGSEIAIGWLMHRRFSTLLQDNGQDITGEDVRSSGPVVRVFMAPADQVRIEFVATYLTTIQPDRPREYLPDVNFTLIWTL